MEKSELTEFNINEFKVGQNLYIDASAGTGKTYTIQQLVAEILKSNENITLNQILIVTYTDKAAGELRDRIRVKIEECIAEKPLDCYKKALQEIHNAPIFTIHSFCKTVLSDLAFEANAAMAMEVIDDAEIKNSIDKLIRDEWACNDEFKKLFSDPEFNIDKFKKNCINAVTVFGRADNICMNKANLICDSFKELYEKSDDFKKNWDILVNLRDNKVINQNEFLVMLKTIEAWQRPDPFLKGFGNKKIDAVNAIFKELQLPEKEMKSLSYILSLKGDPCEGNFQDDSELFILNNLEDIKNRWEAYKKEKKYQSYENMIKTVCDEVCRKNNVAFIEKLRHTYRYAIIDEFQDTNQRQWDIFKKVFLDSPGAEGRPSNNIIVVGDPKQSIYSFQGADLQVYRNAISEIGRENGRRLSVNNRSSDLLINACNLLFEKDFFEDEDDFSYSLCPPQERKKLPAELNGKITSPLWISDEMPDKEFCKYAVSKILECRKADEDGKTALQIFDKRLKKLRNVEFSDFAVLGRTRSELIVMEAAMQAVGIPYSRYKDTNLFNGVECFFWISLLKALNAPDFSGYNRKFLNCALVSSFFRITVVESEMEKYSDPTKSPMKEILKWRMLAANRQWSELQESIYSDTQIDKYLNKPSTMQSLAKMRQIGSYIFDYLYNHKASLEEAIRHLEGLSINKEDVDDEDGNLVAKGNDYNSVKVMTSHASKGLAFPVVIAMGGLKGFWKSMPGPYLYRKDGNKNIGFDYQSKVYKKQEDTQEYRRLMYVAYTRAESLMILPAYKDCYSEGFDFLRAAIMRMKESGARDENGIPFVRQNDLYQTELWNQKAIELQIKEILAESGQDLDADAGEKLVQHQVSELQANMNQLRLWQFSYSSLTAKKKALDTISKADTSIFDSDASLIDGRFDKEDSSNAIGQFEEANGNNSNLSVEVDKLEDVIQACEKYNIEFDIEKLIDFPRGSKVGNAIHTIWEKIDFQKLGCMHSENGATKNVAVKGEIEEAFIAESLPVKAHREWIDFVAKRIWHTLNADLPEIKGNMISGNSFKLNSLTENCRKAEMEFQIDVKNKEWLNRLCKGYMDLLFVRRDADGNDYFSILDWKSDVLEDTSYASKEAIAEKVNKEYSIQRILYSYCLIKWLKQFYTGLSEKEIFEKHFGGIYYVFVRGCQAGSCNGIYAQTWKSFDALESSYKNILKLMEA